MKRRNFIKTAGLISASLTAGHALARISFQDKRRFRYILRGGKSFYQNAWQVLDIGISESGKLTVGAVNSLSGVEVIPAAGKIVSPGFIDILADNAANPQRTYKIFEKYKLADGVTTALQMHGGTSNVAGYYKTFGALPHMINYGVSTAVMQVRNSTTDLSVRARRVEQCLEEGALGVSHSIEYQPTPYEEVLTYAKLANKYNRPFFLHLRYSSREQELEGVDEAIRIAKDSGVRVHIDHLHSTGGTFHMQDALTKIKAANAQGLRLTCCVYPYSYWATYLHSKRFDDGWQKRYGLTYHDLQLVGTGERLSPATFAKYREMKKLVAVPEGTLPLKETVDLALREDFCMIGSDGGIEYEPHANSHPRGAGCFATSIHHAKEIGLSLERILEKIITLPRSLILPALNDRGELKEGSWADLTVFDPDRVNGKASVTNPNQFSDGIETVFVNGTLAYKNGLHLSKGGVGIHY